MVAKAHWSNDRLQQAVTLYTSGHKLAEVCQLMKTGIRVLKRYLRQAEVDIRTQGHWKRLTDVQVKAVVQVYQDGN